MLKPIVLTLILLVFISCIHGVVILEHQPPLPITIAAQPTIELTVKQGLQEVQDAYIYYREIKTEEYKQERMLGATESSPTFISILPPLSANGEGFEYYFEIVRADGQTQTLPEISPLRNPYKLMQLEIVPMAESGFVVLSPMEDEINSGEDFVLAISTYALGENFDPTTVSILLNGTDITPYAEITDNLIVYRQTKPKAGNVSVQVSGKMKDGSSVTAPTMTYTVKKGPKLVTLPFNMRGNINFNTNVYSVDADPYAAVSGTRTDDASTNFNLYGGKGAFKFNTRLYVSTLESEKKQPINRYTIGFNMPSLDIILGDNSAYFSSLTMNNTNTRGLYGKLYTKGFALIGLYGQSKRALDGKEPESLPPTPGVFSRDLAGMRMQFGSLNSFQWSFDFVRSRDIISSLSKKYYQYENPDSSITQTAFPIDNLVLGTDIRLSLLKQSLILGLEGAGSIYNRNILPGPITDQEYEDYMGEKPPLGLSATDFEDIFVINKNMEPFNLSIANIAMQGYLRAFFMKNYLSLSYSQVGASFHSTGASYLQNDTRSINVSDNINIRNLLFLDGGMNIITDNISNEKAATNTYTNWYIQSLFRMSNLPYMRIGYHMSTGKNEENTDISSSIFNPIDTAYSMLDIGMGYDFVRMPVAPTKLDVSFSSGLNEDKLLSAYKMNTSNVVMTLTSRFQQIPLLTRITFNTGLQDNKFQSVTKDVEKVKTSNTEFGLHGEYKLLMEKLIPFADLKTTVLGGDQDKQSYQMVNLGARYMPLEQSTISSSVGFKTYTNSDVSKVNYNTVSWNLNLSQRF